MDTTAFGKRRDCWLSTCPNRPIDIVRVSFRANWRSWNGAESMAMWSSTTVPTLSLPEMDGRAYDTILSSRPSRSATRCRCPDEA